MTALKGKGKTRKKFNLSAVQCLVGNDVRVWWRWEEATGNELFVLLVLSHFSFFG